MNLRSETGRLTFDPSVGNLPALVFEWHGQELIPLHRAVWTDDAAALADERVPLVDRKLAGDFVCVPFGLSDVEPSPAHGWSANSAWSVTSNGPHWLEASLDRSIMGARLTKRLELKADAPVLVQTHTLQGGEGGLTFAHHPMLDVSGGARLSCSPKRLAQTIESAIVPDHHGFALGASTADLAAIPASDGGTINLQHLPIADDTEDFVLLIEAAPDGLGWTAVVRETHQDIVFVLKDSAVLPVTMLWHSNGARTDFPWKGRNRGVLGIEDGRAAGGVGHAAALHDNRVSAQGVATAFALAPGRKHTIRHVIGAIPNHQGWRMVQSITIDEQSILVEGDRGDIVRLPFKTADLFGAD